MSPPRDWDNFPGGPTSEHDWEMTTREEQLPSTANHRKLMMFCDIVLHPISVILFKIFYSICSFYCTISLRQLFSCLLNCSVSLFCCCFFFFFGLALFGIVFICFFLCGEDSQISRLCYRPTLILFLCIKISIEKIALLQLLACFLLRLILTLQSSSCSVAVTFTSKEKCDFWLEGGWRYSGGNQLPNNSTNGWFTRPTSQFPVPPYNAHFFQRDYPGGPILLVPATDLSCRAASCASLSTWGSNDYFAPSSYVVPPLNGYFTFPTSTGGHVTYVQAGPPRQTSHFSGPFCNACGSHFSTLPEPASHLPTAHDQLPTWRNSDYFRHSQPSSHVVPPSNGYFTPPTPTSAGGLAAELQESIGQVVHCPDPLGNDCDIPSNSLPRSEPTLPDALSSSYSAASRPSTPRPSRGRKRALSEVPESEAEATPPVKRRCMELEAFLSEYGSQSESYGERYPWPSTFSKETQVPEEQSENKAETTPSAKRKRVEMEAFLSAEYGSQSESYGEPSQQYPWPSTLSKEDQVPGEQLENEAETTPPAKRRCVEVDSSLGENSTQTESPDQCSRPSSAPNSPEEIQGPAVQPPDFDLSSPSSPAAGFHTPPNNSPHGLTSPNIEPKSLGSPVTHLRGIPSYSHLVGWRPVKISLSAQILEKKAMTKAAKRLKRVRRSCGQMGLKKFLLSRYLEEKELLLSDWQ